MFRKFVGAVFLAAVTVGFAAAEEFYAAVTKVEGGQVTFRKIRDPKANDTKPPEYVTLPAAKDVKVFKPKGVKEGKPEADQELPGGLDNELLKEELKKVNTDGRPPITSYIITDDGGKTIKAIRFYLPVVKKDK